jgi:hypothetical protein
VLTLHCARVDSAARYGAAAALSLVISAMIVSAASADGMLVGGCVGGTGAVNCVVRWGEAGDTHLRLVPEPTSDFEKKRSADRDHKWEERCRPTIAQDRYGVPRYQYAAPGCEFGIID